MVHSEVTPLRQSHHLLQRMLSDWRELHRGHAYIVVLSWYRRCSLSNGGHRGTPHPPPALRKKQKLSSHELMRRPYDTRSDTDCCVQSYVREYLRATMKTMVPATLGATLFGLHLTGNHQADGFVVVPVGERTGLSARCVLPALLVVRFPPCC